MEITVKITKDVLKRSMMCGRNEQTNNCMVAIAIHDLFPQATVYQFIIAFTVDAAAAYEKYFLTSVPAHQDSVRLPMFVTDNIKLFDSLSPIERLDIPPFSFEIEVPHSVIGEDRNRRSVSSTVGK